MAAPSLARRLAFDVLMLVQRGGYAADLLRHRAGNLLPPDAALAHEIVFGVLRRLPHLDVIIQEHISKPLQRLDTEVRTSLRMGAYQLHFLDRVPSHAAVAESVALCRYARKVSAMGMVNAVLRKIMESPLPEEWPNRATRLCMPDWLLRRWDEVYGAEQTEAICEAFSAKPDVYVRIPAGKTPENYPGAEFEATEIEGCFRLTKGNPAALGLRQADIGSQWVGTLVQPDPDDTVLDLCAAPGNKTAIIAERAAAAIACDIHFPRLQAMGPAGHQRVQVDATAPLPFQGRFRRILLDAPCSGTGTLGRNPEIRWRITLDKLREFPRLQRALLRNALQLLAADGTLVYSTCSLEPEENENIVRDVCHDYDVELFRRVPGEVPGDGFFAAIVRGR